MGIRWRIALLLAFITTINYIDRSVFGVVAPVIRDVFSIGDADYGLITSGFLLAYGVGQLVSGPIIDRLGTKRAFGLAAMLWSAATVLHGFGRGVWSFFTCRFVLGLTEAANFPAATKAVAEWFPARERSTAVGIFMLGAGLGAILTPPLTVWTIETMGWRWAFIIPGLLGVLWVLVWQKTYHAPETHPTLGAEERRLILRERSPQESQESWISLLRRGRTLDFARKSIIWLGGSLFGLIAGRMIETSGYTGVFVAIAFLHLVSALILQIFVPRIRLLEGNQ